MSTPRIFRHPLRFAPLALSVFLAMFLAGSAFASEGHASDADAGHDEMMTTTTSEENAVVSPDLYEGETWTHTFTEAGLMEYHCHPHPWMIASIEVVASDGRAPVNHTVRIIEPEGGGPGEWAFEPAALTVMVGDSVTWVNEGQAMHKVREMTEDHQHGAEALHDDAEVAEMHDSMTTTGGVDDHGHTQADHAEDSAFSGYVAAFLLGLSVGAVAVAAVVKP